MSLGFPLMNNEGYFILSTSSKKYKITSLKNFDKKQKGYISYFNKSESEALQCYDGDDKECEFRNLKPDDGTTAGWFWYKDNKWNLIMFDCVTHFLDGIYTICDFF